MPEASSVKAELKSRIHARSLMESGEVVRIRFRRDVKSVISVTEPLREVFDITRRSEPFSGEGVTPGFLEFDYSNR